MTEAIAPGLDSAYGELERVRESLRNPKIGLLQTRALYRRMGELYALIDKLEEREYAGQCHPHFSDGPRGNRPAAHDPRNEV